MSLRLVSLVLALGMTAACGGGAAEADEPQTARDKQYAEAKKNGELDDDKPVKAGGWRFKGDRKDCRFLYNSKCFPTDVKACAAAGCGVDKCKKDGAGPTTISCSSVASKK